ncbi:MAG: hypothetical protein AVDCRST_MAG41-4382, partial [uncultured Corynebacteriales bacterium]
SPASRAAGSAQRRSTSASGQPAGPSTCWAGPSGPGTIRVRSASCRATTPSRPARSAAASSGPVSTSPVTTLWYASCAGTGWCRHSASCAKDSGSGPDRSTTGISGAAGAAPADSRSARYAATAATVGPAKKSRSGSRTPCAARTSAVNFVASSEWPPRAKKSSSAPTCGTPSRSPHSRATDRSRSVRGSTKPARGCGPATARSGSAARSTVPSGVSGSAGSSAYAAGTAWSGNRSRRWAARSAAAGGVSGSTGTTKPTSRVPASPPRAVTAASATSSCPASADSTRAGSTRKPRTRGRSWGGLSSSIDLSGRQRPQAPLRRPPTCSSPGTPTGCGCSSRSSTRTSVPGSGRPESSSAGPEASHSSTPSSAASSRRCSGGASPRQTSRRSGPAPRSRSTAASNAGPACSTVTCSAATRSASAAGSGARSARCPAPARSTSTPSARSAATRVRSTRRSGTGVPSRPRPAASSAARSSADSSGSAPIARSGPSAAARTSRTNMPANRSAVARSNRSVLYSSRPQTVSPSSNRSSSRSNSALVAASGIGSTRTEPAVQAGNGTFWYDTSTWNTGVVAIDRSGCSASTRCSNGIAWCSYAATQTALTRRSRARNDGSPPRSVRSATVLTNGPISGSSSTSGRLATGVPTTTSSVPDSRCSSTFAAAASTMNRVAPSARASSRSRATSGAGSSTGTDEPRYVLRAGRGRSVGRPSSAGTPASCPDQYARSASRPAAAVSCCQAATSGYCTASSGRSFGRPVSSAP